MNFREHIIGGCVTSVIATGVAYHFHWIKNTEQAIVAVCCGVFASLYPDIDIKSKSSRLLAVFIAICCIICWLHCRIDLVVMWACIAIVPMFLKHRGFTHSHLCAGIIATCMFYDYGSTIKISAIAIWIIAYLGYFTHLALDGIPFKWK